MAGITVTPLADYDYDVIVSTSDVPGTGTDGDVFVTIEGTMGSTGEIQLSKDNAFERAGVDVFPVSCKDLGEVKKLTLRLTDDDGIHSLWHVANMDMLHKKSGMQSRFAINDWVRINTPVTVQADPARDVYLPYQVTVITSDNADASFDGEVSLTLKGDGGITAYKTLLGKRASDPSVFQFGSKNQFTIRAADVGKLASVMVDLNATGNNSSWRPKQVGPFSTERPSALLHIWGYLLLSFLPHFT